MYVRERGRQTICIKKILQISTTLVLIVQGTAHFSLKPFNYLLGKQRSAVSSPGLQREKQQSVLLGANSLSQSFSFSFIPVAVFLICLRYDLHLFLFHCDRYASRSRPRFPSIPVSLQLNQGRFRTVWKSLGSLWCCCESFLAPAHTRVIPLSSWILAGFLVSRWTK